MNVLADMSQSFMGVTHAGHEVHYFTWTNLKGSVISILIGAAIYFLIVRGWMMKKAEDGTKVYVNRWSKYFDLEDYIYRPILIKAVPAICGMVCMIFDHIVDGVVVLLKKTIFKDSPEVGELEEGNEVTHALGVFFNGLEEILNHVIWRKHPHHKDFEHALVLRYDGFKENLGMISRSLSYGLLLFCLGLCATLLYLLLSMI